MAYSWGLHGYRKMPTRVITVEWRLPKNRWHKLNCDGVVKGNPKNIGARGLIRDETGFVVLAFAKYLRHRTNMFAELSAVVEGLQIFFDKGFYNVWVKMDTKAVIDILMQSEKCH